MKTVMWRSLRTITVFTGVTVVMLFSCRSPIEPPALTNYTAQVVNLNVVYRTVTDDALITWDKPAGNQIDFYEIHRSCYVDSNGMPINETIFKVASDQTQLINKLDLLKTDYFFYIVPCMIEPQTGRLVKGIPSPVKKVNCSRGIHFSIDNGAAYAIDSAVTLNFRDDSLSTASICFTQDTVKKNVPAFTAAVIPVGAQQNYDFPWILKKGPGMKSVWLQVNFKDNTVDTVMYDYSIKPYKVKIRFQNKMAFYDLVTQTRSGPSDASVIQTVNRWGLWEITYNYIFNKPKILFNVLIDMDSTIDPNFEYFLLSSYKYNDLSKSATKADSGMWIETAPRKGQLTGIGAYHDEKFNYTYSIDTAEQEGRENLSSLQLIDNDSLYPIATRTVINQGNYIENFKRFKFITRSYRYNSGKKEFILVLHFKGRFFGEDRWAYSRLNFKYYNISMQKISVNYSFFDFYQPVVSLLSSSNINYINNNDTLYSIFDFLLTPASAKDDAYSRITELSLIIAEATPEKVSALKAILNASSLGMDVPISYEDLVSHVHYMQSFPLRAPLVSLQNVRWNNIDPSQWRSGQYFMGVVTCDEYGNRGFAPVSSSDFRQTNPWYVTFLTGK